VLYGHTHEKLACEMTTDNDYGIKLKKPLYVMNPGSIGSYPYPFGVITVDREGRVLLSHGSLD
jgi:predicted phosphodiesterase